MGGNLLSRSVAFKGELTVAVTDQLHFISGLPRSGSTLFSAILRQNPSFYAAMSTPLGGLYLNMLDAISEKNEFAMFIPEKKKPELLLSLFHTYYRERLEQGHTIFDTNRLWCAKANALAVLFPKSYIFCCVRNLAWILDSLERVIRANPFNLSKIFNFERADTVYSRTDTLVAPGGLVGFAWNGLREAFFGEQSRQLILVQYESLTRDPQAVFDKLYDMIGQKRFTHDFDNVAYDEPDFDARLGTPGLHKVRSQVRFEPRKTVLPPDIFERFESWAFWTNPKFNPHGVPVW
jgi:sulfotransferase